MSVIELDLRNTVYKPRALGPSIGISTSKCWITTQQLQGKKMLLALVGLHGDGGLKSHAVFEVTFVGQLEELSMQIEPALNVRVLCQGAPHVVDLVARVHAVWVNHEGDLFARHWVRSNVNKPSAGALPHSMELGFDEHAFNFPDCPAQDLLAAIGFNHPLNGCKAFIAHSVRHGLTAHMDRQGSRVSGGLSGDLDDMGFVSGRRGGHGALSAPGNPNFAN
jgi:hypothetical protein